jgi:hypothetical protein
VLGNKAQAVGGVGEDADALISHWCPGRPRLRRRLGSGRTAGAWASRRGRRRLSRSTRGWPRLPRGRRRVAARQRSRDDIPLAELPCAVRLAGSAAFVPQGTHAVLEDAEACGSVPVAAGCRFVSLAGLLALDEAERRHPGLPWYGRGRRFESGRGLLGKAWNYSLSGARGVGGCVRSCVRGPHLGHVRNVCGFAEGVSSVVGAAFRTRAILN